MKKLAIFICAVALLLAPTNVAMATKPISGTFAITVEDRTIHEHRILPSGLAKFSLTDTGGVIGYFTGTFTYDETGVVDLRTGRGTNQAVMTIRTAEGTVTIRFQGQTDFFAATVDGNFALLRGTDKYEQLQGQGTYEGYYFAATFRGRFHYDPR